MRLLSLIESLVLESRQEEILRKEYLETGKVSEEDFNKIMEDFPSSFHNKWMLNKVANKIIKSEDIYKFKEYFDIHRKNTNKFPIADLGQIKTLPQVNEFISKAIEIRERNIQATGGTDGEATNDAKNLATGNEIAKLQSVGIKFLGIVDGYQCFEIPNELKGNEEAWKAYRDILGRCANRDKGARIDICTIASFSNFNYYLNQYDGSSYFVFFNLGDPQSPYQFHYESNQFMDRNDKPLI